MRLSVFLHFALCGVAWSLRICARPHFTITSEIIFQRVDVPNAEKCIERCIENMDYCSSVVHLAFKKKKMDMCIVHSVNSITNTSLFHPDASTDPKSTVYELLNKCSAFAQSDMAHRISPYHRKILETGTQKKTPKSLADSFLPDKDRFNEGFQLDEGDRYATMKSIEYPEGPVIRNPFDDTPNSKREKPEYPRKPNHSALPPAPIRPMISYRGQSSQSNDRYSCPGGICGHPPPIFASHDASPCPARQGDPCAPKPPCREQGCFHLDRQPQVIPQWGEWGPCSVTCGPGMRMRDCVNGEGCLGLATDSCQLAPCATWTDWSPWTLCSTSCGQGERQRTRICSLGRECDGPSVMVESCMSIPCPTWAPWSSWQGCSMTCGVGTERRYRICVNGLFCAGPATEERRCDRGTCPHWSDWSRWADCTHSCGGGEQVRQRECIDGTTCAGGSEERVLCNQQPCPAWTPWTDWSVCEDKCGEESARLRNRICLYRGVQFADCEGPAQDQLPCPVRECATWTEWKEWSECSATCGQGNQMRSRSCSGGNDCSGASSEFRFCQVAACPYWGEWTAWGGCSVTCGMGYCQRTRKCITDELLNIPTLSELDEAPSEVDSMNAKAALIARSKNIRMMAANTSAEVFGNVRRSPQRQRVIEPGVCDGPEMDKKQCDAGPCCGWDQWSEWSPCIGCGLTSTSRRTRQCSVEGGGLNLGFQEDTSTGYVRPAGYSAFSPLSGLQPIVPVVSRRGKRHMMFQVDASQCNCPGSSFESRVCIDPPPCARQPPSCQWSEWGEWCGCTPCRAGREKRRRFCDRASRPDASCHCPGNEVEERTCTVEQSCFNRDRNRVLPNREEDQYVPIASKIGHIEIAGRRGYLPNRKDVTLPEDSSTSFPYSVCRWSTWSQFTDCDDTSKRRHRHRFCIGNDEPVGNCECPGMSTDEVDCDTNEAVDPPPNVVPGKHGRIETELAFTTEDEHEIEEGLDSLLKNTETSENRDGQTETTVVDQATTFQPCEWSRWSTWSDCTKSCGLGTMLRKRRCPCSDGRCLGSDTESEECQKSVCAEQRGLPIFRLG